MADSSGSDGGVSGASGVGASDGASSAASAAASAQAATAQSVAEGLVDAATGPAGVDTNQLAGAVAALQSQVTPSAAAELQAAVEAQLSPVEAGQFQAAVDAAAATSIAQTPTALSLQSPLAGIDLGQIASLQYNAQGQAIDACGNPVDVMSVDRSVPASETDYAKAVENLGRAVGGPISGPAYTAAWASGADQQTLDTVHALGQVADGAFGVQHSRAEQSPVSVRGPEPAGWHQTQR
jgi:hypothetical protein